MNPTRFAVLGTGRMARAIVAESERCTDYVAACLVGRSDPAWPTRVPRVPQLGDLPELPRFLVDFSLPDGTREAAAWCAANGVPLVSGVTGLPAAVDEALDVAARRVPLLWSPNLSLGVNLLADLAARAGAVLGAGAPVSIHDVHHRWKKDAPSGTALMLGERIAAAAGADPDTVSYHSEREGEVIGDHVITLRLPGETLELAHRASDRSIYARGALDAAAWLLRQAPGRYSAADWIAGAGGAA